MTTAFFYLVRVFSTPLNLLNVVGTVVGLSWLLILGKWELVLGGTAALFLANRVLAIAMLPGGLIALPAAVCLEKGHSLIGRLLMFCAVAWTVMVSTAWGVASFLLVGSGAAANSSVWPFLLWAYAVATVPFAFAAQKELQLGGGLGEFAVAFFVQIGAMFAVGLVGVIGLDGIVLAVLFALVCAVGALITVFRLRSVAFTTALA